MTDVRYSEAELAEFTLVRGEVLKVRPDATVQQLPSGYGYEIYDPEWTIIALVSWGQDGSARLVMVSTAIDGGWWGLRDPVICNYNVGHKWDYAGLARSIAGELAKFFITLPRARL